MTTTPKTILIIDDDADFRKLLAHLLKREGYEIAEAVDGEKALDYLWYSGKPAPSLIILDLIMPVMDGWKFRGIQKSDPKISHVPVIVITSGQTAEQDISSVQVSAFLKKPIQIDFLLRTVKTHCL
jgi:CheY-like chemotaxis protein